MGSFKALYDWVSGEGRETGRWGGVSEHMIGSKSDSQRVEVREGGTKDGGREDLSTKLLGHIYDLNGSLDKFEDFDLRSEWIPDLDPSHRISDPFSRIYAHI